MTKKAKSNFFLLFVVLVSAIFYFYHISQNKGSIKIQKDLSDDININNNIEKNVTKFTNVEYKTSDDSGRDYITKGKEAYLNKDQPDLIEFKRAAEISF